MKCLVLILLLASLSFAQKSEEDRRANTAIEPFRIIGNVYYVGAAEVTSFLITTPKGHFLIDSGYAETVPQIRQNIKTLGFKVEDIKVLLNTQSHFDHAGGLAELKKLTGAKMISSIADKIGLEKGGRDDFTWGDTYAYDRVVVDKVITNNDTVAYGGVTLKAVLTPGHTKGCTTWLLTVKENGRKYRVVFVGSTSSPGYKFYGNAKYPNILADYKKTFAVMKKLRPHVFLASHGSFFDLLEKAKLLRTAPDTNPFIDPKGYKTYVAESQKAFREKLVKERPTPNIRKF